MKIVVHKLGGSTIGNPIFLKNIIKQIKNSLIDTKHAFVVSAINTTPDKNKGTTTLLEKYYNTSCRYNKNEILENIYGYHCDLCNDLDIPINPKIKKKLDNCNRNIDTVIGVGEEISSIIFSDFLNFNDLKSSNYILATSCDSNVNLNYKHNRNLILDNLSFIKEDFENNDIIPVYSGFLYNINQCNMYKLLGRGYSDTTGVIISNILNATKYNIWKESGGVFTAHPNKISNANILKRISLNEASELTSFGNDVLHSLTAKFAKDNKTNINVIDSDIERGYDTEIVIDIPHDLHNKDITAICSKGDLKIIEKKFVNENLNKNLNLVKHMNPILLSANKRGVSLLVDKNNSNMDGQKFNIKNDKSIICCIGENMVNNMGIASKVMSTLSNNNINIEMISQGPEEINISIVLDSSNEKKALEALHKEFLA